MRMLKTQVTLVNISHVLLNLIGTLLNLINNCYFQILLLPLSVHAVNIYIFLLVHQLLLLLTLAFFSLALSVWLVS